MSAVRLTAGGLAWSVREIGGDPPPIVLLHGFTGTGEFWRPVAERLAPRRCILPDLPGHGGTEAPIPPAAWGLDRVARSILALLDRIGIDRFDLVGYSMGGRIALRLALAAGSRIERIALIGSSPGIPTAAEREARRAADEDLAAMIERDGIEAFVARWEALPIFASQGTIPEPAREAMRSQRLGQDPRSLAAALRAFGVGTHLPVHDELPRLATPILLVAGEQDTKYIEIASRMGGRCPDARVEIVGGAGHAVPIERPEALARILAVHFRLSGGKKEIER